MRASTEEGSADMTAPRGYVLAWLHEVDMGEEVLDYMTRIEETFAPFGGSWLVHGSAPAVLEGDGPENVVIIGFPSPAAAREWYTSPGYRRIEGLRTRNARTDLVLLTGVPDGYRAADTVAAIRAGTP